MSDVKTTTRQVKCTTCGGSGQLPTRKLSDPVTTCGTCRGSGQTTITVEVV